MAKCSCTKAYTDRFVLKPKIQKYRKSVKCLSDGSVLKQQKNTNKYELTNLSKLIYTIVFFSFFGIQMLSNTKHWISYLFPHNARFPEDGYSPVDQWLGRFGCWALLGRGPWCCRCPPLLHKPCSDASELPLWCGHVWPSKVKSMRNDEMLAWHM